MGCDMCGEIHKMEEPCPTSAVQHIVDLTDGLWEDDGGAMFYEVDNERLSIMENTKLTPEQHALCKEVDRELKQLEVDAKFFDQKNNDMDRLNKDAEIIADDLCEILETVRT